MPTSEWRRPVIASPRYRHVRCRWPCGTVSSLLHVDATREVDDGPLAHPHSLGSRAEQTGLLLATGAGPLTFQRTLMPRSTSDQALITGLSFAANHTLTSLLQESLQSAALLFLGAAGREAVDERRWSRATLAVDAVAIGGRTGRAAGARAARQRATSARRGPRRGLRGRGHRCRRHPHRRLARVAGSSEQ